MKLILKKRELTFDVQSTLDTALSLAIDINNAYIAHHLLEVGANPNAICEDSPILFKAMEIEFEEFEFSITKELLETGANVNCRNYAQESPLHIAVQKEDLSLLDFLIKRGGCLYSLNDHGQNLLFYATSFSERGLNILENLLQRGPWDMRSIDFSGNTLLHSNWRGVDMGVMACREFYVSLLHGADISIKNSAGCIPDYECHCDDFTSCPVLGFLSTIEIVNSCIDDIYVNKFREYYPKTEFADYVMDDLLEETARELYRLGNINLSEKRTALNILFAKRNTVTPLCRDEDKVASLRDRLIAAKSVYVKDLLEVKLLKGQQRKVLIEEVKVVFRDTGITDVCLEKIFLHLSQRNLMEAIKAAEE